MIVVFEHEYLQELYTVGKASDKKHLFQPQIVAKYIKVINLMKLQTDVLGLAIRLVALRKTTRRQGWFVIGKGKRPV
jgi:hypothetical protein